MAFGYDDNEMKPAGGGLSGRTRVSCCAATSKGSRLAPLASSALHWAFRLFSFPEPRGEGIREPETEKEPRISPFFLE